MDFFYSVINSISNVVKILLGFTTRAYVLGINDDPPSKEVHKDGNALIGTSAPALQTPDQPFGALQLEEVFI